MLENIIFLDTETTGIDPLVDRIFQVAYKFRGKMFSAYFKPPVPISVKSMSISHVTNKDIADKDEFSNSQMKKDLIEICKNNILVAHNAGFDVDMIGKEGVKVPTFIDTLKLIRFLDEENIIPEYNLQYLRYFLDFDIKATAHDARGDVLILEQLFKYIYKKMLEKNRDEKKVISEMIEVTNKPFLMRVFNYGKHKGKKVEEVLAYDKGYLEWLLEKKLNNERYDEDWIYTLKYHLQIHE